MKANSMSNTRLIIPALAPLYAKLTPVMETVMRVLAGGIMVTHGWPKVQAPMGTADMVAKIGFAPTWFWAPGLAVVEFFGGILLLLGLLTRPVAVAMTVVLLVTVYFHWVMLSQGLKGSELSILWAAITAYFAVKGGNQYSVDHKIGRAF